MEKTASQSYKGDRPFSEGLINPNIRPFSERVYEQALPFPGYDFPRLHSVTERLKRQYDNPGEIRAADRVLTMPLQDFMFFKNLVSVIETSRHGTAPENPLENKGFIKINYQILLLLISRLKRFPARQQLEEFYKVVAVIEDFGNIEACLVAQYKSRGTAESRETLYKLLYALDKSFEKWIYDLLEHTKSIGTSQWNKYFVEYRNELRLVLLQFTNNVEHVNICFTVEPTIVSKTKESISQSPLGRRTRDFYAKLRNNFILVCDYVGLNIPIDTHIFFQYLQNCGEYLCNYYKTIDSLADLGEALGSVGLNAFKSFTKKQAKVFLDLLKSYCALREEVSSNNVVQGLVAITRGYGSLLTKEEYDRKVLESAKRIAAKKEKDAKKLSGADKEKTIEYRSTLLSTIHNFKEGNIRLPTITVESVESLHGGDEPEAKDEEKVKGPATFATQHANPGVKEQRGLVRDAYHGLLKKAKEDPLYGTMALGIFLYASSLRRNPLTLIRLRAQNELAKFDKPKIRLKKDGTPRKVRESEQITTNEILYAFVDISKWRLAYNVTVVAPKHMKKHGYTTLPLIATVGVLYANAMEELLDIQKQMQVGLEQIIEFKNLENKEAAENKNPAENTEAIENKELVNKNSVNKGSVNKGSVNKVDEEDED
jgi:hypothetical protein